MEKNLFNLKKKEGVLLLVVSIASIFILNFLFSLIPNLNILNWGVYTSQNHWDYIPIYIGDLTGGIIFVLLVRFLLRKKIGISFKNIKHLFSYGWSIIPIIIFNFASIEGSKIAKVSFLNILLLFLLSFISAMMVGFFEELIFRRGLLIGIRSLIPNYPKTYILLSSLLFGLIHLNNLGSQSFWDTMNQVYMAFSIGVLFSVIYLASGNLLIPILFHTLIDTTDFFTSVFYTGSQTSGFDWVLLIISILFLINAYLIYRKLNLKAEG